MKNNLPIWILRKIIISKLKRIDNKGPLKLDGTEENIRSLLFDKVDDHYEIAECFKKYLSKIDFSNVSFDNVDISGVDFTGATGVKINPQTIYGKSLFKTILCDVLFSDGKESSINYVDMFEGVNVINANFTGSKGAKINPQTIYGKNLVCTICNGVEFVGAFEGVDVRWTDFAGSKGAKINPQTVRGCNLGGTKCCDVEIVGPFDGVWLLFADFNGSIGAKIDFETLKRKFELEVFSAGNENLVKLYGESEDIRKLLFDKVDDHYEIAECFKEYLSRIDFSNVSFDNVDVRELDFTGSKGVKINPQTIHEKSLFGTNCNGVKFIGFEDNDALFDDVFIRRASFKESTGVKIDPQTIYGKDSSGTIYNGVKFIGVFDGVDISFADFTGSNGARINPQTILLKDLYCSNLCDVEFIGPFDGAFVQNANFTGSKGARINLKTIRGSFQGKEDVQIINSFSMNRKLIKKIG